MNINSNVLSKFRQFYGHFQDKCIYDEETTYIRDKEQKEINHLLVSPTRTPANTFIMRRISFVSGRNTNSPHDKDTFWVSS